MADKHETAYIGMLQAVGLATADSEQHSGENLARAQELRLDQAGAGHHFVVDGREVDANGALVLSVRSGQ